MTKVTIYRDEFYLHAEGHSKAGKRGKDVICAAISTLTQTFAHVAESMDASGLCAKKTEIETADGELRVRVYPRTRYKTACQLKLDTVAEGLLMLQEEYPKNLVVEIR